jgi:hypothetical protein
MVKTIDEKKDKDTFDMDGLHRMILKLSNNIIDLKINAGEISSNIRAWKPSFRKNTPLPNNPNFPPEEIHIEEFYQDHYFQAHEANHSEKNCPTFINMFKVLFSMEENEEGSLGQDKQRDDRNTESSINLFWDVICGIKNDDIEEERSEEICISQTKSKEIPSTFEATTTPP